MSRLQRTSARVRRWAQEGAPLLPGRRADLDTARGHAAARSCDGGRADRGLRRDVDHGSGAAGSVGDAPLGCGGVRGRDGRGRVRRGLEEVQHWAITLGPGFLLGVWASTAWAWAMMTAGRFNDVPPPALHPMLIAAVWAAVAVSGAGLSHMARCQMRGQPPRPDPGTLQDCA